MLKGRFSLGYTLYLYTSLVAVVVRTRFKKKKKKEQSEDLSFLPRNVI